MRSWTLVLGVGAMWLTMPWVAMAEDAVAVPDAAIEAAEPTDPQSQATEAGFDEFAAAEPARDAAVAEPVAIDSLDTFAPGRAIDPVVADEMAAAGATGSDWDSLDAPAATPQDMGATPAMPANQEPSATLGPLAIDDEGRRGRIHTVISGDTLWDISTAYLGTPWVWPAVWQDNDEIANPHRIDPGDRVWITDGEMRVVTETEADQMISAHDQLADAGSEDDFHPAELLEGPAMSEDELMADEVPAAMDSLSVAVPLTPASSSDSGRSIHVAEREVMGFVSADEVDAATSIVDSPSPRNMLVEGDSIYMGLGEGEVQVGDEFTIFRDVAAVADVEGNVLLGYHVDVLGWAVVREITGDSSIAEIRMSNADVERGDRMIPRVPVALNVPIKFSPEGLQGNIVFMPNDRTRMGDGDYVYLNRGSLHGFEVGSAVEVYEPGALEKDKVSGRKVMTPDSVVGKLVIVTVRPDSSVAFVVRAGLELEVGDRIRPVTRELASN